MKELDRRFTWQYFSFIWQHSRLAELNNLYAIFQTKLLLVGDDLRQAHAVIHDARF